MSVPTPSARYVAVTPSVMAWFASRGVEVAIEPQGSRGPDVATVRGEPLVGEIKHAGEIVRDLKAYWSHWNANESFGGKTREYRLRTEFPADVETLSTDVRGWIAVIYGQLRHYAAKAGLPEGWLIVEESNRFQGPLNEAIRYLVQQGKVRVAESGELQGAGFICFRY